MSIDQPPTTQQERHPRELVVDGLPNVRDVGGLPLRDGGVVECGRILRSASPQLLTDTGPAQLYQYGVRTVVDLRSPREADTEGHGPMSRLYDQGLVRRISVPLLSDAQRATDPVGTTAALDDPAHHYINYLSDPAAFARIARAVLEAADAGGAALFHCALGKDRTGVSVAVMLDAAGAVHADVVDDYDLTRRHVRTIVERLSGSTSYRRDFTTPDWEGLAPQPAGIAGMLRWLHDRFGHAGNFLVHGGLSVDELDRLRRLLRYIPALT